VIGELSHFDTAKREPAQGIKRIIEYII